jgi:hypothetical protein
MGRGGMTAMGLVVTATARDGWDTAPWKPSWLHHTACADGLVGIVAGHDRAGVAGVAVLPQIGRGLAGR